MPLPRSLSRLSAAHVCAWVLLGSLLGSAQAAPPTAPTLQPQLPKHWSFRDVDGGRLYALSGLSEGTFLNTWAVTVEANGTPLQTFAQARDLLGAQGLPAPPGHCNEARVDNSLVLQKCTVEVKDQPPVSLQFVMLPMRDGKARLLRVAGGGERGTLRDHADEIPAILKLEVQRWKAGDTGQPETARSVENRRLAAIDRQVRTAPGQGLKRGDYETVLFSWDQVQDRGLQYRETIYLLLADGTAYRGMYLPPEDFNLAAAKQLQPKRWVQWRKKGDAYEVRDNDTAPWVALRGGRPAVPGRTGQQLDGSFLHATYTFMDLNGGSTGFYYFIFKPDGRFEQRSKVSWGSGLIQETQGVNSYTSTTSDGNGTRSSSTAVADGWRPDSPHQNNPPTFVGAGGTRRNDGDANRGTYRIDGWTLELHRDNGVVERQLFLFSRTDALNIGGTNYSLEKKP